jgi:hypothetical protein
VQLHNLKNEVRSNLSCRNTKQIKIFQNKTISKDFFLSKSGRIKIQLFLTLFLLGPSHKSSDEEENEVKQTILNFRVASSSSSDYS